MDSTSNHTVFRQTNQVVFNPVRMTVDNEIVIIRDGTHQDHGLIISTWLTGLYYGNTWFREIERDLYFNTYKKVVKAILNKPTTEIKIACLKDDEDTAVGYAVFEDETLHWAFTRPAWRCFGFAKKLVPLKITTVTHLTNVGRSIKHKHKWVFNPFLT
jgi:hypothetical protein